MKNTLLTPLRKLRSYIKSNLPEIIGGGIAVVVIIGVVGGLGYWGVSTLYNESTTKPIAAGELVFTFDKNGHIIDVIKGPATVPNDAEVLTAPKALDGSTDVTQTWHYDSKVIIDGVEHDTSGMLTATVNFEEAVAYFNSQVDQDAPAYREDAMFWWVGDSLQNGILNDIHQRLYAADDAGVLEMHFKTVGMPTIEEDTEVMALYEADLAVQAVQDAEAAAFDAHKAIFLEAIEEICVEFTDANRFYPGLCPEVTPAPTTTDHAVPTPDGYSPPNNNGGKDPKFDPAPPTQNNNEGGGAGDGSVPPPDDYGYQQPRYVELVGGHPYDFGCASYPVVLTNGESINQAVNSYVNTVLVHIAAVEKMDITIETALPCKVLPSDQAGE